MVPIKVRNEGPGTVDFQKCWQWLHSCTCPEQLHLCLRHPQVLCKVPHIPTNSKAIKRSVEAPCASGQQEPAKFCYQPPGSRKFNNYSNQQLLCVELIRTRVLVTPCQEPSRPPSQGPILDGKLERVQELLVCCNAALSACEKGGDLSCVSWALNCTWDCLSFSGTKRGPGYYNTDPSINSPLILGSETWANYHLH